MEIQKERLLIFTQLGVVAVDWEREEQHRAEVRGLRADLDEAKDKALKLEAKNAQLQVRG